jgi:hypothetical protein
MTQRNTHSQTLQAMPAGMPVSLPVAFGLSVVFVLISLITVLSGAGFGIV